jgi:RNA polymerase sigma factor (TIGR02999 family)
VVADEERAGKSPRSEFDRDGEAELPADADAAALLQELYSDLRRMAGKRLLGERAGHTLQPTALVHEAYLRLDRERGRFANREHFLALAARAMRRVLLDHARRRVADKRGSDPVRVTLSGLDGAAGLVIESEVDPIDLERALSKLGRLDERQVRVVELRYFAGATTPETAKALGISTATVEREWRMARAWLRRELGAVDSSEN